MILVRATLVAVALVAGAWLAVQERGAVAEEELTRIAFDTEGRLDAAQRRRIAELLPAHRRLNADRRPDLIEAFLLLRDGRDREALAILRDTVRAEPDSVEAWALLARAASRTDPPLAARARARVRELAPPVPPA